MKTYVILILLSVIAACSGGDGGSQGAGNLPSDTPTIPAEPEKDATPYNVVLIIADDLAYDHYSFTGHPVLKTPSIDSLAAQSVRFPAAYVSSSCRPTQATLLTGLPEHRHEVTYLKGPQLGDFPTIADRLVNVGYSSYMAGKFWEGSPGLRGFTAFTPFDSGFGNLDFGRTTIDPVLNFMNETSSPWFVWFSPQMPHIPHNAPDEFIATYEGLGLDTATVNYFAMISWFDSVVGALLREVGDDTVVIYLADNGYVQSGIGELYAPKSKVSSYEYGIRTQLLIRHPEHEAIVYDALVSAVDVVTTILSIAGATRSDLPGLDLLALAEYEPDAFGSRSSLGLGLPTEMGMLLERWAHVGDWKLVDVESGEDRLHNLVIDPGETLNLVEDPASASALSDLRSALENWWQE